MTEKQTKMKKRMFTIRIPDEIHPRLKAVCALRQVTIGEAAVQAFESWIARSEVIK